MPKQTKARRTKSPRPAADLFELQSLESRLLFSANNTAITDPTLAAAAISGLQSGLNEVIKLGGALDDFGAIGTSLAGVGQSVGSIFDFGSTDAATGFLKTKFAQPLLSQLQAGVTKASDVKTYLAGLTQAESGGASVTVTGVTGGYYAATNEFEWDFTLKGKKSTTFALNPGSDLATEGLSFASAANVTIGATVDFHLSIGMKADGTGFFITLGSLGFAASADTGNSLNFNIGFNSGGALGVVNGSVKIDAALSNITFPLVTPGAGGRIGGTQLTNLNVLSPNEAALGTVSTSLHSTLPLNLGVTGLVTVLIDDTNLIDSTVPDVQLKYYLNNAGLKQNILDTLGSLDSKIATITNSTVFDEKIPLLDKTIRDFLPTANFTQLLSFQSVAQTYFNSTSTPEVPGLVSALTTHLQSLGTLAGKSVGFVFDAAKKDYSVTFDLTATQSATPNVKLPSFGDASTTLGLSLPTDVLLTVNGQAKANFTLGLDLTTATFNSNTAYLKVNEISAGATVAAAGLNFGVTLGPLAANVVGATVNLAAKASVGFSDPNSDGKITLSELGGTTVSLTPTGSLDVNLPLQLSFGGYDFKDLGVAPSLHLTSTNPLRDGVKVDTNTPNFSRLFNLGKMGPEQVLDLMIAAGDWAERFRDSSIFDISIPFLNNVDLGDAFDFGLLFSKNLRDKLSTNEAQLFSTKTSLNLATAENFLLQVDGDAANSKTVTIPAGNYPTRAALVTALTNALSTAYGLNSPVKVTLEDGPDRKPNTGDERVLVYNTDAKPFSLVGTYSDLKDLGFYADSTSATFTAGNDAVTNGRTSGNVTLGVSINGGTPVNVTLNQSATTTNSNVADLAADLQAAFAAAGVSTLTVSSTGNKLVVTGGSVKAFMIVGNPSVPLSELGLEEASQGGIGSIGSTQKTGAKFATFQELVPLLASALGIPEGTIAPSYDPATETIKLHVKFGYEPTPLEVPVSFDLNLGDLAGVKTVDANGNEAPLKITLTPKLNAELDFGYSFKPAVVAEQIKLSPPQGYVSPAGYVEDAATVTLQNWSGQLSADAVFTVILDNAKSVTLTVPKSATTTNTSVADLVSDFNTAIAGNTALAGKLTATMLPGDAASQTSPRVQLATVAGASRGLQIKTAETNPAHTEIGYELDSFGQISNLGLAAINLVGETVSYAPGADAHFTVSIDDAAPVTITVLKTATDGNTSMADLLTDLNTAIANAGLSAKLQATRFGAADRIQFSVLGSTARTLRFDTDTTDAAHTKLGFNDAEIYQRLRGGEFFIENAKVHAEATLAVTDLRLAAQIGFIGIKVGNSGGSITLSADAELKQGSNKHFTIGSLFEAVGQGGIGSIVSLTKAGSANFALNNITIDAGLFTIPTTPTISFVISDLFGSNLTFTPTITGLPSLPNFKKLDFKAIFDGVKLAVDTLANYQQFGFLNYKLPIINVSVTDLFDYANQFKLAIAEIENNPAGALQYVEKAIEDALNLPPSLVTLSIDGANLNAVKISISLQKDYSTTLGLNLDLKDLGSLFDGALATGWEALSSVIDASAEGNIQVAASAKAQVDFGIDLTGATARPFLYDTSGIEVGVRLAGTNLNLNANIGIVGLQISGGTVLFDSDGEFDVRDKNGNLIAGGDGVIDNDFATIRFGLKDNNEPGTPLDGRHYLTESFTVADDFALTFQGQFKAVLPASIITPLGNFDLEVPIQLSTSVADFAKLIQRLPGFTPIHLELPSLKDLLPEVPGLIQLLRDPSILLGGIDNVLYKIQQGLDSQTAQKLPLIGGRLSEGAQMIEDFREGFLARLTEKLRGAGDSLLSDLQTMMFDFFGPNGSLKILKDLNHKDGVTKDDIVLTFRKADGSLWKDGVDSPALQEAIEFNLQLGQEYIAPIPDLKLDFALPGLELKIEGTPEVKFDWNMFLGFGVSLSDLFYVNSKPTSDGLPKTSANTYAPAELEAGFSVKLTKDNATPFTATGTLFFLQLQATDKKLSALTNQTTGTDLTYSIFKGSFQVDLNDPGTGTSLDDRITFPELFKRGGTTKVIDARLSAVADINLGLNLSVNGSKVIPRILADFNLDWSWSLASGASPVKAGFNNVALDLGSFISDFLKPLCDQIDGILKPFDPILKALQTRIPVLSDLMGRDYTLLDLAVTFGNVKRGVIDAIIQIRSLVADIAALPAGQSIIIPMGSIVDFGSSLTKKGGTKDYKPEDHGISAAAANLSTAPQASQNVINKSKSVTGGGFAFPILKPANVFKLLMGQEATLFTYDVPRLEVGMSFSASFSIFGPLVATFSGSIKAFVDIAVGFDTKGLNQFKVSGDVTDILDGFYVSDRANADGTGADVPEAGMVGEIAIGGGVNLAIVKAGVEGFFTLTANLDLNDPNDDGKIRGSEIVSLLTYKTPEGKSYGLLNLASITLKGEVGARAYVSVFALFSYKTVWTYEFARFTIFEKTFAAPKPVPTLASVSNGLLQINAGTSANKRAFGSVTDVGESFTLTQVSPGQIKIRFENSETEQIVSGVTKVVFNSGKGNDVLDARGLTVPVEFDGGEGDDVLYAGNAGSILNGGLGNDTIYGGSGADTIIGGAGSDEIIGGDGNDIIEGGDGNDTITTGKGNDTLIFRDNWGVDSLNFLGGTDGATEANRDTFDFSAAAASLTMSIGTNQSKVVAGKNSITADDSVGELRKIIGGSGADIINVNSSSPLGITLDGGKGADTYSIGFGRLNGIVTIGDSNANANEDDTIVVAPVATNTVSLYDAKLLLNKMGSNEQVNYTGIESLTVDAAKNVVNVEEALTFDNNVRIKGNTIGVKNSIDGGYIRVDSGNAIKIDADLNAHANGNIEVVTSKGDIDINSNIWSSANKTGAATGSGAGVLQLISRMGQIVTDSTGTVRADVGYLLLQGGTGSIGTPTAPILTQVATLAGKTTGTGVINIREADGVIVGEVSVIAGLTSNGGNITVTNNANSLTFNSPASAFGGNMTYVSDQVQLNAPLTSPAGVLLLEPLNTTTDIAIGNGLNKTFMLDVSEIAQLTDGFDSVHIGRMDGRHAVYIEDITFTDPTYLQNPILGGHVYQTGKITGTGNASLTILGSGHTTDLDNQDIANGNINILDSGRVRAGESVRLEADNGNININFDLDGAGASTTEKLTLNAPNGLVTIKGNIGALNIIDELVIENAQAVRFEGNVKVGKLIIQNVSGTFIVDGTVNADTIDLRTVGTVDFNSSVTSTTSITHPSGTIGVATFEGAINSPTVSLSATSLLDFYQNVSTGALTLTTTGLTGDILLRQQLTATGLVTVQSMDAITFQGPVSAATLTVNNVSDLAFQSTLAVTGALTQTAGTGTSTFGAVTVGSTNLNAASLIFNSTLTANSGAVTLRAAAAGNVSVTGAVTANSGALTVSQTGSATFSAQVNAQSASLTATQFITVANSASFTTTTGAASFTTSDTAIGEIRLTGSLSVGTVATLNSARGLTFLGSIEAASGTLTAASTINLGTGSVTARTGSLALVTTASGTGNGVAASGPLSIATAFTITSPRAVTLSNSLQAASVNIDAAAITLPGTIETTGAVTLRSANTGNINLSSTVTAGGAFVVDRVRDLTFGGLVTAASISVGSTEARIITVGMAGLSTTGDLALRSTVALGSLTVNGPLTSASGTMTLTSLGDVSAGAALNADRLVASGANVSFTGAVTADGVSPGVRGIAIDTATSAAGLVSFGSTVSSSDSLIVGAAKRPQIVTIAGTVNLGNDLTLNADQTITANSGVTVGHSVTLNTKSTTAGEIRFVSTLSASHLFTLTTERDAFFQGVVTVGADLLINKVNALQFQAALFVTGTLTQTLGTATANYASINAAKASITSASIAIGAGGAATTDNLTLSSTAAAGSLLSTGALTSTNGVLTATTKGALTVGGAVKGDRVVVSGSSVNFNGTLEADGTGQYRGLELDAAVNGVGSFNFASTVTSAGDINIGVTRRPLNLTFSGDLIASSGSLRIRSNGDVSVSGETRAPQGSIQIDLSDDVTLTGAVTAQSIGAEVNSLTAGGSVTATDGSISLNVLGDIAVTGATTASGSISISRGNNVTLSGAVKASSLGVNAASFLAGNALTTTSLDAQFTTTGNIRVVGLASIAQNLIVDRANNVTFQGQAQVTGIILQTDGTGTTRFEGVTQASVIDLRTAQQIFAGSTFRALTGDIALESDEIDFVGGTNTVQGSAQLILRPYAGSTTIDIGSPTPTGTLDLSDVDLNALRDGFTQIIIGRPADATGAMLVGSSVFKDNVTLYAGSITVENNALVGQQVSTLESLELNALTGGITINDDLDATDVVLNARDNLLVNATVQGQDFVTVQAGTDGGGNITVTALGSLEGTAAGSDVTIFTGALGGDLNIAGLLAAKDNLTLTAASGRITQTAGQTMAADLVATAEDGITLLTTVDHISASVTSTGDLTITDNNPSATHTLVLGSQSDVNDGLFTAAGDITVTANGNGSAFRVVANGGVFLNFGGEVFVGTVNGSPSRIIGTILLDEDRTTQGQDITFDGNVRLLRDITLTSNGGDISITGRVSGTVGSNFGLTLNAGGGNVSVGGPVGFDVLSDAPLGFLTINGADDVTFGSEATDLAAIRVLNDLEINSNSLEFNAPDFSVRSLNNGALRLLPVNAAAAIDIGSPMGGAANYALGDDDLRALGNGFSSITIGQAGGTHAITLESAQLRDSLVLNGDVIRFLTSSTPQSVTGVSVVNGSDDNSITINARSQFTQGRRAAIAAGRNGDITITADVMELDGLSANVIRGFGALTLQPFTPTQAITLGGAGTATDFDLTVGELGALADGFRLITIGRANGEHAITAAASLTFRDSIALQAPAGLGSITLGNTAAATKLRTIAKGDSLTLRAGNDIILDSSLATAGAGALTVIADADFNGGGNLNIGQNLATKNPALTFTTEQGAQVFRGETITVNTVRPATAKFGGITFTSKTGNISFASNLDNNGTGAVTLRNAKTVLTTGGTVTIGLTTAALQLDGARLTGLAGVAINAAKEIQILTKASISSNLFVNITAGTNLSIVGSTLAVKAGSFQLRADRDDATDDGNSGLLTLGAGTSLTAKTTGLLSAFQVIRDPKATVKAAPLSTDQG